MYFKVKLSKKDKLDEIIKIYKLHRSYKLLKKNPLVTAFLYLHPGESQKSLQKPIDFDRLVIIFDNFKTNMM